MPTSPCGPHVPRIRHLQAQGPHAQFHQASLGVSLPPGDRTNLRTVGDVDVKLRDAQGGAQWKRQDVCNLPRAIFHGASTLRAYKSCYGGVLISDPTPERLDAARSGIDGAQLAPTRSKPDQRGEIHCLSSVVLTYEAGDPINAAAALRDVELRRRVHGAERAATPLFHNSQGEPYTHHQLHLMLRAAIAYIYGKAAASLYSWHSYRSGLATALHAAGVDDAMIQLICRWMCPESLHVYRRMGVTEHERLITGRRWWTST